MTKHSSNGARISTFAVLGLALFMSGILSACGANVPVVPTAVLTPTARPSDLATGMVKNVTYPSLSYGVHAFLWWNDTARPRELENIRMLRFQYVKQIFDLNDIKPERDLPPNWQHADAVVNEIQYRGLKVI